MVLLGGWTWLLAANNAFAPPENQSPAAAVDALKAHNPKRVLNDLPFGGYLIWRQIPVFVDGRAELYGEAFDMAFYRAMQLKDVNEFLDILKKWDIDAVLLMPHTPAAGLLDHIGGWRRVYADGNAVLHVRTAGTGAHDTAQPIAGSCCAAWPSCWSCWCIAQERSQASFPA